jgi:hypothetical protein
MADDSPGSTDVPDNSKSVRTSASRDSAHRSRVRNWFSWAFKNNFLIGILTGLISGVVVSFYLTATGQAAFTALRNHFVKPSCANPEWLLQVPSSDVFASAYYMQRDQVPGYGAFHVAGNTIDGDLGTSWLQFWPSLSTGSGKSSSDYIEWSFAKHYDVRLICIVNGWTEDVYTYKATLPIGGATVYATDEAAPPPVGSPSPSKTCASQNESFKDYLQKNDTVEFAYQWQPITFHCVTNNVILHIDSVSETSIALRDSYLVDSSLDGHRAPLTGLSEVKIYYCPAVLCLLPTS